jgi:chromosomal replication initiator protein
VKAGKQQRSIRRTPSTLRRRQQQQLCARRRVWPWPRRPANPTIRCSFTAASVWARRICCMPSASTWSPQKGARVAYVSSEKFTNEYIDAIQNNQLVRFRKQIPADRRAADRRHPVPGRQGTHSGGVLPHLQRAARSHKQIVLTCDRPGQRDPEPRTTPGVPLRVGAGHRPPAARRRNPHGHPPQEGADPWASSCPTNDPISSPTHPHQHPPPRRRAHPRGLLRLAHRQELTVEVVEGLLREVLHEEGRTTITIEPSRRRSPNISTSAWRT